MKADVFHAAWLRPQWPAPPGVHAVCSTRAGGVSQVPYDSLNLGDHVGDAAPAVAANRQRYAQSLGVRPVFLRQVHGQEVLALDATTVDGLEADASVTATAGLACTVMVADCLPVLLADAQGHAVAAAHAGWRGLAGRGAGNGVLEAAYQRLHALGPQPGASAAVLAWLGPCIGPAAFEVGPPVYEAFVAADPTAAVHFRRASPTTWWADLAGLARQRLHALGVSRIYGNDSTPPWCTVSQSQRFFSYRRDRITGRLAASIWLQKTAGADGALSNG